jgi:lipid-A-disaccharide synthase-like uncharacterized protein
VENGRIRWAGWTLVVAVTSVASLVPLLWLMERHVETPNPSGLNNYWLVFGFCAQLLFAGRLVVQWLVTERRRHSTIPVSFWWLSLIGGLMLLVYFWRRGDPVGIAGQLFGNVVYVRNLYFLYADRRGLSAPSETTADVGRRPGRLDSDDDRGREERLERIADETPPALLGMTRPVSRCLPSQPATASSAGTPPSPAPARGSPRSGPPSSAGTRWYRRSSRRPRPPGREARPRPRP